VRIVKSFEDVQIVLRELLDWKSFLSTKDWDFKKLRIKNASPAVDPNDYVTLSQLGDQVKPVQDQVTNLSITQASGGGGGSSSGTVTNTGTLVAGRLVVGNGGVNITQGSLTDETNNNVSSSSHGLVPKSPSDATKFLNGAATPAFALVKDSDLSTSDITTNDVSASKHGFAPKLPDDATKYLDGTGAFSAPFGSGSSGFPYLFVAPPSSGWSWQNQNVAGCTNTVDTSNNQIILTSDGVGDGLAAYVRNTIAATFTITAVFTHAHGGLNDGSHYSESGLIVTDGTKSIIFGPIVYNGSLYLAGYKWTNSTTPSAAVSGFANPGMVLPWTTGFLFVRIVETASARKYYISDNFRTWTLVSSTSNTDFLTTSKYGMHIRALSVNASGTMYSFAESNP
jgi:hypothetical protein